MIIPMPSLGSFPATNAAMPAAPALLLRRQATALGHAGQHAEAAEVWRSVLYASPDDADAAHELGLALTALGRHADALGSFERALTYAPASHASKLALGRALLALGRHADARLSFEDMLVRAPDDVEALVGQATSLRHLGRHDAALMAAERAAGLEPGHADAMLERARALTELKRPDEALAVLEELCAQHKDHLDAAQLLGRRHLEAQRPQEAVELFRQVVAGRPDDAFAWQELACALRAKNAFGEALDAFRRALAIKPAFAAAYANMSMVLADLGRIDEAIQSVDRALSIEPDSRNTRFLKGCIHLTRGEFGPGWEGYEHRFSKDGLRGSREDVHAAPWLGEPLAGRSILVLGEQANGDYIQFSSHLPRLVALGAKVSLFVPKRLKRLFTRVSAHVEVIDALTPALRFDYQCHLMSLPHRFHLMGEPVPTAPWLSAEPDLQARWRARIGGEGFRVGVAWQGSNNDARSFSPFNLAPLAGIPGVRLVSLHTDATTPAPTGLPAGFSIETLGADFDSGDDGFIDAAAAIENVDLVISCDTSIAHLAGALGRPVWVALRATPEWRWQRDVSTSIWYPSMRLFRQGSPGEWDGVFHAVATELRSLASGPR